MTALMRTVVLTKQRHAPAVDHAALEQLFRACVIAFLVEAGLLTLDQVRMLRDWVHFGFQSIEGDASPRMCVKI